MSRSNIGYREVTEFYDEDDKNKKLIWYQRSDEDPGADKQIPRIQKNKAQSVFHDEVITKYPTIFRDDSTGETEEVYVDKIMSNDTDPYGMSLYRVGSDVTEVKIKEGRTNRNVWVSDACIESGVLTKDLLEHAYSLQEIHSLVNQNIRTFDPKMFNNCINLKNISGLFSTLSNTVFDTIPEDLFESKILSAIDHTNNSLVVDCSRMFAHCSKISYVPDSVYRFFHDLEKRGISYKATDFVSMQYDYEISDISVLPRGLFDGLTNVRNLCGVLPRVSKVAEIPDDFFKGILPGTADDTINLNKCFSRYKHITSIPSNLFDPLKGIDQKIEMWNMFSHCESLTSIPEGLFEGLKNVTAFAEVFFNCSHLTGPAPRLWEMFPNANGRQCFTNCTGLSNYDEIPDSWK